MTSITINLSDLQLEKIKHKAEQLDISLEDCIKVSIDQSLVDFDPDFTQAAAHVLTKNRDLYQRLA